MKPLLRHFRCSSHLKLVFFSVPLLCFWVLPYERRHVITRYASVLQPSERMKVVDVLSSKVYSDGEQIIAQVNRTLK